MRVTDLDKFSLEHVWRPYQTISPIPTEKRFESAPANLDETYRYLTQGGEWSRHVLARIKEIGVTFPDYVMHPIVYYIRATQETGTDHYNKPDHLGRVWRHCESGLSLTAASLSRFMLFALRNRVEVGEVYAFSPKYIRSLVLASVRLRPDQFEAFERETGGTLREPPRAHLNSGRVDHG